MKFALLCLALLVIVLIWMWPGGFAKYAPGVLVADAPDQNTTSNGQTWTVKGYTIKALPITGSARECS